MLPPGNKPPSNQNQNREDPAQQNEDGSEDDEEPAKECRRLIAAMTEFLRSQNEQQPNDQVKDGDTGKERRYTTHHIMEDGEECQMLVVDNLLWIWQSCFHGEEVSRIRSSGLLQIQPSPPCAWIIRRIKAGFDMAAESWNHSPIVNLISNERLDCLQNTFHTFPRLKTTTNA